LDKAETDYHIWIITRDFDLDAIVNKIFVETNINIPFFRVLDEKDGKSRPFILASTNTNEEKGKLIKKYTQHLYDLKFNEFLITDRNERDTNEIPKQIVVEEARS